MRPIERSEVLPIGEYEQIRPRFRQRVIEEKRARRVRVGEHMSLVFENRDTVLFQIQEMLRTERITSESGIGHEIETYNDLIPGEGQLSVTLFVEIPDKDLREQMLVELRGLEEKVAIEVDGERFAFGGKRQESMPDRTTAVHYLKASLSAEARAAMRSGKAKAAIVIEHPRYEAREELGQATLASLAEDLA